MYILELSKVLMHKFHYDYIKKKYGSHQKQLFTDTDSLMYDFLIEDFFKDFSSNKEMFGFSNYLSKSRHYNG